VSVDAVRSALLAARLGAALARAAAEATDGAVPREAGRARGSFHICSAVRDLEASLVCLHKIDHGLGHDGAEKRRKTKNTQAELHLDKWSGFLTKD
jgi:hypothetical protein